MEELNAIIGLKMCDGIGDITANKLISFCGSASAVFEEKSRHLSSIPGVPAKIGELLKENIVWELVEKEVDYINRNNINYVTLLDREYPKNLLSIDCAPLLLFFTGTIEKLNTLPCISIVGTRHATPYGIDMVAELVACLQEHNICIVSGLALGIDVAAHKASIRHSVPTFGIVGHGLKTIYPSANKAAAEKLVETGGGIVSEFFFDEIPNRENFPKRNRIIAGLSFATIVVEAAKKGGALITADLAYAYKRKVFAVPGRYNDKFSEGCNELIKNGKALPVLSISSLIEDLGLKRPAVKASPTVEVQLTSEESALLQIIRNSSKISLDNISAISQLCISGCAAILFGLEMKGIIRNLPGKIYEAC